MRKILTIDGGGMKGAFPASFLARAEEMLDGKRIVDYFDLIVGTSTGGLIALALGMGLPACDIVSFYRNDGPEIFKSDLLAKGVSVVKKGVLHPGDPLRDAIDRIFGDRLLGESLCRLVIPSFCARRGAAYLYKTAHHPDYQWDYKDKVRDIALATSAAPIYLPTHRTEHDQMLIDGGVWANNPMSVAAIEAIHKLNWQDESILMLSLGCTEQPFHIEDSKIILNDPRALLDLPKTISSIFMAAQATAAKGIAELMLGAENVIRINPTVPSGEYAMNNADKVNELCSLGQDHCREKSTVLRQRFFAEPVIPFGPIYNLKQTVNHA